MRRLMIGYLSRLLLGGIAAAVILGLGTWWHGHGERVVARIAAWTEPPVDDKRPPVKAKLGPVKRAYFERLAKAKAREMDNGQAR